MQKLRCCRQSKTAECSESKALRLCPSLSSPLMHTLQWPELWNAFPTGPTGREADREGYVCVLGRISRGGEG